MIQPRIILAILGLIFVLFLSGCFSTEGIDPVTLRAATFSTGDYTPYVPVSAAHSYFATYYDSDGHLATQAWKDMTNEMVREKLPDVVSSITVENKNASVNAGFLVANVTGSVGEYSVTFEYIKYYVVPAIDKTSKKTIGTGRIGVGMRMTAGVSTNKENLDLGNLLALGIAAQNNDLSGRLHVQVFGIDTAGVTIPITDEPISQDNIQQVLTVLATLKSKIADSTTILTPYVLEVKPNNASITVDQVKAALADKQSPL
jgi:hypothetical protein